MSFQWAKSTVSARALTIGDDEDVSNLASLVRSDPNGYILVKHVRFAEFEIGAVIEGEWPIPRVTPENSGEEVQQAYAAWRALPRAFAGLWQKELASAENIGKNG